MSVKVWIFALLFFLFGSQLFAQESVQISPNERWEYLLVSVSYFGDKEELKISEKYIGRRQGNVGFHQDLQRQNEFDRLGSLGWELVGILPVNQNDQPASDLSKFIFKRRLDFNRSARETEELKRLTAELKSSPPNAARVADLIELDRADYEASQNEIADRAKTRLEQAIKNANLASVVSLTSNHWNKQTYSEIVLNGNAALLEGGNKYRASEAKAYARRMATELFSKTGLRQVSPNEDFYNEHGGFNYKGEVVVKLSVVIIYNGATRTVATGFVNGNWTEPLK